MTDLISEIDRCETLFLIGLRELDFNTLTLIVQAGVAGAVQTVQVGSVEISDCTAMEPRGQVFELIWQQYVGYSVLNESYALLDDGGILKGKRYRVYTRSNFLNYMSKATLASDEYPGPAVHYELACEDHLINILAVNPPTIRRLPFSPDAVVDEPVN